MTRAAFLVLLAAATLGAEPKAKNVILFIGDAGGLPALHAASLYHHNDPQKLFIQNMPHIGLSDTSATDVWVTDSAAGMTAIVTGQKTNNGVISQSAKAVRGKQDGEILKTILEYAEERGLSTGVVTNMNATDATPAACYAHANDRRMSGEIFAQVVKPRFGDGVDVLIGAGRDSILAAATKVGMNVEPELAGRGYKFYDSLDAVSTADKRVVALFKSGAFDVWDAIQRAHTILSRNKKGYFLMVEWDTHTLPLKAGLDRVIQLDGAIRKTSELVKKDTLILFAADHSFDIRVRRGRRGEPMLNEDPAKPNIRVENGHTGEQVVVAAMGPGAQRVRGFIPNTELFRIMLAAYGWK
jgi:alkaline phosphatase